MKSISYFLSALVLSIFGCGNQTGHDVFVGHEPAVAAVQPTDDVLKDKNASDKKETSDPTAVGFSEGEEGKLLSQLLTPKPQREPLPLKIASERPLPPNLYPLEIPNSVAIVDAVRMSALLERSSGRRFLSSACQLI